MMIAAGLAKNGAKVYIGARRGEKVEGAAKEIGPGAKGQVIPLELDISNKESIKAAVKLIQQNDGKLDLLFNNAGQTGPVSSFVVEENAKERKDAETFGNSLFDNEEFDEWGQLYSVNVAGIFFVTTAFLGLLQKASEERGAWSASVINISSISGQLKISQGKFCYNSAKAANIHLTKMFATEFALKNIKVRVNTIAPGTFPSEMTSAESQDLDSKGADERLQGLRTIPFQRGGADTDMAGAALFLGSPASYYITGQVLNVDGGVLAVHPATGA
ncbi:Enoyl-(Acyl carrier protein) reductase [Ceratobasidium sp. AG-Ba]|nr:Enoyl-(Acyl carrier protein) reductase [Ceratobasidium sp. AG-Ba]